MISKKVPHTYIQHGIRFFAMFLPIQSTVLIEGIQKRIDAHNFYIFSEAGFCWLEMKHVDIKYVLNQLGTGFFKTRTCIFIDTPIPAYRDPLIVQDPWIQGSADRGYALEAIREGLGLNLTYLSQIFEEKDEGNAL